MKQKKTKKPKVLFTITNGKKIIWQDTGRTVPGTETPSVLLHVKG